MQELEIMYCLYWFSAVCSENWENTPAIYANIFSFMHLI